MSELDIKRLNGVNPGRGVSTEAVSRNDNSSVSVFGDSTNTGRIEDSVVLKKSSKKNKQNNILEHIKKDLVTSPLQLNWDSVIQNFNSVINQYSQESYYINDLKNATTEVLNLVKGNVDLQNISSKKDVDSLFGKLKKQLNKKDELYDFKLDVLKELVGLVESHQKAKEYKLMETKYNDLIAAKKSGKEAYEATIADKTIKALSYFDDIKKQLKARAKNYDQTAMTYKMDELQGQYTNSRKLRKAAKKSLGKETFAKVSNNSFGERIMGGQSFNKRYAQSVIAENNVSQTKLKKFPEKDFTKKLKNDVVFERLKANDVNLIKNNGDGTYNLEKLSELIEKRLGADYLGSTQRKDYDPYGEVENVVRDLKVATGLDISEKDAIALIELCGYKVMGKNFYKVVADSLIGTLPSIAGAAAGITLMMSLMEKQLKIDTNEVIPVTVNVDKSLDVNINIALKGAAEGATLDKKALFKGLPEELLDFVNITKSDNGYNITIKRELIETFESEAKVGDLIDAKKADKPGNWAKSMGAALASQFAMNLLINTLSAHRDAEIPVAVTQFNETDLDKYINTYVKQATNLADWQKPMVELLARSFVDKNGKWDSEGYKKFLNDCAGDASFLNAVELIKGLKERVKLNDVITGEIAPQGKADSASEPENKPTVTPITNNNDNAQNASNCQAEVTAPFDYKVQAGDSWTEIVNAFYPGLDKKLGGMGKAITALKRALANGDEAEYQKLRKETDLRKHLMLPGEIDGITRVDKATVKKVRIQKGGHNNKQVAGSGDYVATDSCDESQQARGKTAEEAKANLEKKTGKTYQK